MHMCERVARAVHSTWSVRLAPISEDKGQYSKSRGGEGGKSGSGFEPAKALVRGLPLPRPPSFRVVFVYSHRPSLRYYNYFLYFFVYNT